MKINETDKTFQLNNSTVLPMIGLGVYKITDQNDMNTVISEALQVGYRLIDTASFYKNEDLLGNALMQTGAERSDYMLTTKVWNNAQRIGDVEGAFNRSLERLHTDYIDLYLIHWPVAGCTENTWSVLEQLYDEGKIRAIGVSNFSVAQLEELMSYARVKPVVNQIEFHPLFQQNDILSYCQAHDIHVEAYAPLARGAYLDNEILINIGSRYGKTAAQVGLRWLIQSGITPIPKSITPKRLEENCNVFDFELNDPEMEMINSLNEDRRTASIPDDL